MSTTEPDRAGDAASQDAPQYRDDLGNTYTTGSRAYDYYSMEPGRIGRDAGGVGANAGWFDFEHDDGTTHLLNGQRICSMEHARRMGWPNTDPKGDDRG